MRGGRVAVSGGKWGARGPYERACDHEEAQDSSSYQITCSQMLHNFGDLRTFFNRTSFLSFVKLINLYLIRVRWKL